MPIIAVPVQACGAAEYARLVPGSRVEYRGTLWKVVGMYFAPGQGGSEDGHPAASPVQERTKYLILQSLDRAPESLQYLDLSRR